MSGQSRTHLSSGPTTPPAPLSGFYLKKRKWPLKGYHKRYFSISGGILVYGKTQAKVEKRQNIHGKMDLGDAAITPHKVLNNVHLDAGQGSPIHIKPLNTKNKEDDFLKLLESIKEHKAYRSRQTNQSVSKSSHVISPWSTLGSSSTVHRGVVPSFSEMTSIDEVLTTPNIDNLNKIGESISILETHIVKLTQIRADYEEMTSTQSSPKKTSVAGKMKNSIKRKRDKGSINEGQSSVTNSMNLDPASISLDKNKSISQPDLSISSAGNPSPTGAQDPKPNDILRECEKLLRTSVNQMAVILEEQKKVENRRSLDRNDLVFMENQNLKRENQEKSRLLQQIHNLTIGEGLLDKNKSRMSFRANSLEQQYKLCVEESINGSTRDLFYDCEEELYMSGNDSSEEEHSDSEEKAVDTDSDFETETEPEASIKSNDIVGPTGYHRRKVLPVFMSPDSEVNLWNILKKNIGKDLTKVAMPVSINQPLSALQRIAEDLEYSELLDEASQLNGVERMIKVCAFALSTYAKDSHRPGRKPFNPILGETYELQREDKGIQFFAEQVSHHPPISVGHGEGQGWEIEIVGRWKNKFWGKSMEIHPLGKTTITFTDNKETYSFNQVTSCVHNLFSGDKYLEFYGECIVKSSNGMQAKFTFQKAGWMSGSKNEVIGEIKDEKNNKLKSMFGRWDEGIYLGENSQTAKCVWRQHALPTDFDKYYGFTLFAIELNELMPTHSDSLPHTDSRWRTDQRLLENGDIQRAQEEKSRVEGMQRVAARKRDEQKVTYLPRFFSANGDNFKFNQTYWSVRNNSEYWNNVDPLW